MNWALRALAQSPRKCPRKRGRFTRLRGNPSCVHYAGLTTTLTNLPGTAIILTTCMLLVNSFTLSFSRASFSSSALSMSLATDAFARTLPFTWNTTSTVFSTALEWSASGQATFVSDSLWPRMLHISSAMCGANGCNSLTKTP